MGDDDEALVQERNECISLMKSLKPRVVKLYESIKAQDALAAEHFLTGVLQGYRLAQKDQQAGNKPC